MKFPSTFSEAAAPSRDHNEGGSTTVYLALDPQKQVSPSWVLLHNFWGLSNLALLVYNSKHVGLKYLAG